MRTKQGYDGKDAVTIQDAEIITVMIWNDAVVVEERRWSRDRVVRGKNDKGYVQGGEMSGGVKEPDGNERVIAWGGGSMGCRWRWGRMRLEHNSVG